MGLKAGVVATKRGAPGGFGVYGYAERGISLGIAVYTMFITLFNYRIIW